MTKLFLDVSFPGVTDSVLPLDDAPDTPYLSSMEVPIDDVMLEGFFHSNVQREEKDPLEALVESSRSVVMAGVGDYLLDAIQQELTIKQYQIFYLYYLNNYTQEQIANMLQLGGGQPVVAQMLHLCEMKLRKKLGPAFKALLRL